MSRKTLQPLIDEVRQCTICKEHLPLGPRPIVSASTDSRILIIGQAPGKKVHESGIPWDDKSGDNLRAWMGISTLDFYDAEKVALMPMGFCYPGKGKSGDLPPRAECAPQWHDQLQAQLNRISLTLLIGKYAQGYYLENLKTSLTETVRNFRAYQPRFFVLPHPSPRNNIWRAKNPWFDEEVLPALKLQVRKTLA